MDYNNDLEIFKRESQKTIDLCDKLNHDSVPCNYKAIKLEISKAIKEAEEKARTQPKPKCIEQTSDWQIYSFPSPSPSFSPSR